MGPQESRAGVGRADSRADPREERRRRARRYAGGSHTSRPTGAADGRYRLIRNDEIRSQVDSHRQALHDQVVIGIDDTIECIEKAFGDVVDILSLWNHTIRIYRASANIDLPASASCCEARTVPAAPRGPRACHEK